jgi:hypothetical protein
MLGEGVGQHLGKLQLLEVVTFCDHLGLLGRAASIELGLGEDVIKRELGAVLLKLEGLQDELIVQMKG